MQKKNLILIVIIAAVILLVSIYMYSNMSKDSASGRQNQVTVYTSFFPLYDTASKIAGNSADVETVIPKGAEAHSYKPSPKQIAALEKADIFFYIGLGMEPWADKVVNNSEETSLETVRVSKGLDLIENNHHHQYDTHVWLDPLNMLKIAEMMKDKLVQLDPDNKEIYEENFKNYQSKIEEVHNDYKSVFKDKSKKYIMVSHAAFSYLAERYGFKQLAVSGVAPHEEPSPGALAGLTKKAEDYGLEYIFMETLASPRIVNVLAEEANLEILTLHTAAGLTGEQIQNDVDYFTLMKINLDNLNKAVGD
ncbi:MAG: metal ABC transporter solute-binding protein, Zn/Mn family [Halothermotrichaceae bacterium]